MTIGSGIAIAGVWLAVAVVICAGEIFLGVLGAFVAASITEDILAVKP